MLFFRSAVVEDGFAFRVVCGDEVNHYGELVRLIEGATSI